MPTWACENHWPCLVSLLSLYLSYASCFILTMPVLCSVSVPVFSLHLSWSHVSRLVNLVSMFPLAPCQLCCSVSSCLWVCVCAYASYLLSYFDSLCPTSVLCLPSSHHVWFVPAAFLPVSHPLGILPVYFSPQRLFVPCSCCVFSLRLPESILARSPGLSCSLEPLSF